MAGASETQGDGLCLLVASSDREYLQTVTDRLQSGGSAVVQTAGTLETAVEQYSRERPDCVFVDETFTEQDRLALLAAVRGQHADRPFFMIADDDDTATRAVAAGVTDYFTEPAAKREFDQLATQFETAVAYYRSRKPQVDLSERATDVLDAAEESIVIVRSGEIVFLNSRAVELFRGTGRDQLTGRQISDLIETEPEEYLPGGIDTAQSRLRRLQTSVRTTDSELVPVDLTATRIEWEQDTAVILVLNDRTGRQRRTQELTLKTRAMDTAPVGLTIADALAADNPLIYANRGFEEMTGYEESEVLGQNCRFLQGPETSEEPVGKLREAIDAANPVTVELRNYRKDGTMFWNRVTVAPIENDAGEVTHFFGCQQEITERKQVEEKLGRFRRAVEAAGHGIFITDAEGRIEYVNEAFETMTGYESSQVLGNEPAVFLSSTVPDDFYEQLYQQLSPGETHSDRIVNRHRTGGLYHAHQTVTPITGENEQITGFVVILTDITEQVEHEQQLAVLERVLRHNLRNDLNVMMSHAELIASGETDDIEASARTIVETGEKLVEMAQKERKATKLLSQSVDLKTEEISRRVEASVDRLRSRYPAATVSLSLPAQQATVTAVSEIGQAVIELVRNAIEHSDSDSPSVDVAVRTQSETVQIRIEDEGPPIPAAERDVITGQRQINSLRHGSGIGLWLTNWIVRRSGGTLDFDARKDGNVVWITLPRADVSELPDDQTDRNESQT